MTGEILKSGTRKSLIHKLSTSKEGDNNAHTRILKVYDLVDGEVKFNYARFGKALVKISDINKKRGQP